MKMIMVTQCCCGCTVRTGTLIIGVLNAISTLIDFAFEITLLAGIKPKEKDGKEEEEDVMSRGEIIAAAVLSVLVFCACLSLIFGTLKERLKFILFWIIVALGYAVLIVIFIIQIIITVIIHTEYVKKLWEIPVLLIALALSAYSIIVVNSHYRNLKDGVTLPPRPPLVIVV